MVSQGSGDEKKQGDVSNNSVEITERSPFLETKVNVPIDRLSLVYIIFLLNGFGTLMPWNMFATADAYFREVKLQGSVYARNFQSYLGISAQIPGLLFALVNLFIQLRGKLTTRVLISLSLMFLVFLLTTILAAVDTEGLEASFFIITMASVVLINCAVGVYQNSLFGMAAELPMKYSNALLIGNNVSGTIVSIVGLITMASSPDKRMAAIFYFSAALLSMIACMASIVVLNRCKFYRHYSAIGDSNRQQAAPSEKSSRNSRCCSHFSSYLKTYIDVIRQARVHLFNVFFVFFVTLTLFPAVLVDVRPSTTDFWLPADDENNKNYFRAVTCFLMSNVFFMLGSVTSNWIRFPAPHLVWIPVTLRALFIPFFLFCNYRPFTRTLPVLVSNENVYIIMVVLMAFTSGYYGSVAMMNIPRSVTPDKARIAGMMGGFFLILGICGGVNFTLIITAIVGNRGGELIDIIANQTMSTVAL